MTHYSTHTVKICLAALLAGLAGYGAYRLGLPGGFLLDDFPNLRHLGDFGTIDSLDEALLFITSGTAGPTGRPLALASFLLDDWAWPSSAAAFKHTNILLHLLCGVLLWATLRELGRLRQLPGAVTEWGALLGAAWWLAHPMWLGTVLYPVQRMAILAALFCLLGLWCYLSGRRQLLDGRRGLGLLLLWGAFPVAGLAGLLSKENAALLPLLVLVIELTLGRAGATRTPAALRLWRWLAIVLPVLGATVFVLLRWDAFVLPGYASRDFTLAERLLTQPRVLTDYVLGLLLPGSAGLSLFTDDLAISRSPWSPPATALLGLAWIALIGAAIALCRRRPLFAAAVLFFVAAHALESSVFALEMMFWHRNYLPASVPIGLAALGLCHLVAKSARNHRLPIAGIVLATTALFASTAMHARTWADPIALALSWAQKQPASLRAQIDAARVLADAGHFALARDHLLQALQRHPRESLLVVEVATLDCLRRERRPTIPDAQAVEILRHGKLAHHTVDALQVLVRTAPAVPCREVLPDGGRRWLEAALENPQLLADDADHQRLRFLIAQLELQAGRLDAAMAHYAEAEKLGTSYDFYMLQAAQLASHGYLREALDVLTALQRRLEAVDRRTLAPAHVLAARKPLQELHRLKAQIESDLSRQRQPPTGHPDGASP